MVLDKYFNLFKPLEKYTEYPKEYNPRIHGPYNPARFYGKRKKISNLFILVNIINFYFV